MRFVLWIKLLFCAIVGVQKKGGNVIMKHNLSKGWIVAVCLGLTMAFSGCGNASDETTDAPAEEQTQDVQSEEQVETPEVDEDEATDVTVDAPEAETEVTDEAPADGQTTAE